MANSKRTPTFSMDSVPIRGITGNKGAQLLAQLKQQQGSVKTNNMQVSQPAKSLSNNSKK